MAPQAAEAYGAIARLIEIGCCASCTLFWFDESASVRLTPKAVLGLFQLVGQTGTAKNALAANFDCPHCQDRLTFIHDLQRATRFTFWRCANDHGQLITFNQFLAEKNFIRPPSTEELAKLRATVRQINCSQCGAPVNLETDSACPHCGAPIALIDSEGVAKALHDLGTSATTPGTANANATSAALSDAQINALFDVERNREREGNHDLLAIGAAAMGAVLGGWLASR